MKNLITIICCVAFLNILPGQGREIQSKTTIMTLGVFHFAYHNLDVVKTAEKDQINVLEEPYKSEIIAISNSICDFKPTIIALEITPEKQFEIDSLYTLYRSNKIPLEASEIYQLGFRIGKQLNLPKVYCVNDWGRHYNNIGELLKDSIRIAAFEDHYYNSPDTIYRLPSNSKKVTNIINKLIELNNPEHIKERLSLYLLNPFKYEERPGDFAGVDFESGRWFNRNLRIFRNIQRIPHTKDDRILLIIGREHLNLLNLFLDVSKEFDLISPMPYLERAGKK